MAVALVGSSELVYAPVGPVDGRDTRAIVHLVRDGSEVGLEPGQRSPFTR